MAASRPTGLHPVRRSMPKARISRASEPAPGGHDDARRRAHRQSSRRRRHLPEPEVTSNAPSPVSTTSARQRPGSRPRRRTRRRRESGAPSRSSANPSPPAAPAPATRAVSGSVRSAKRCRRHPPPACARRQCRLPPYTFVAPRNPSSGLSTQLAATSSASPTGRGLRCRMRRRARLSRQRPAGGGQLDTAGETGRVTSESKAGAQRPGVLCRSAASAETDDHPSGAASSAAAISCPNVRESAFVRRVRVSVATGRPG
jgi:hypothetical protein